MQVSQKRPANQSKSLAHARGLNFNYVTLTSTLLFSNTNCNADLAAFVLSLSKARHAALAEDSLPKNVAHTVEGENRNWHSDASGMWIKLQN